MLTPLRLSGNIFSSERWLKMWNFWRCGTVNSFWSQIDFCSSQLYLSDQTSIQIHLKSVLPLCGRYCSNYWHFNYNLHWIYAIFCRIIYRVNRYYTEIERRNTGQKNRNQRKINRFSPYMSATDIDCFKTWHQKNTTLQQNDNWHTRQMSISIVQRIWDVFGSIVHWVQVRHIASSIAFEWHCCAKQTPPNAAVNWSEKDTD